MVERQRALRVRPGGEEHEPDAVLGARRHELLHHRLHGLQAIGALAAEREILGEHAAGDVDGEHDVDALAVDLGRGRAGLRTRERHGDRDQRRGAERQQHEPARAGTARRHRPQDPEARKAHGGAAERPARGPQHERHQHEQEQPPGVSQVHGLAPVGLAAATAVSSTKRSAAP